MCATILFVAHVLMHDDLYSHVCVCDGYPPQFHIMEENSIII